MIQAYGKNIIAKRLGSPTVTSGGAIKTASLAEKSLRIEVIDSPIEGISKGDILIVKKYTGDDYVDDGQELIFLEETDILAKEIS